MKSLLALLSLLFFLCVPLMVLGLIRPSIVVRGRTQTRTRAVQIYGGLALLSLTLGFVVHSGIGVAVGFIGIIALPLMLLVGLIHPPIVLPANRRSRKTVAKIYLPLTLFFIVFGAIVFDPDTRQAETPTAPESTSEPEVTPEPVPVAPTPEPTPEPAPATFQVAVNQATRAAEQSQTAATLESWDDIARTWDEAATSMQEVPATSSYYDRAQEKAIEYQANADIARQKVQSFAPPAPAPEPVFQPEPEPIPEPVFQPEPEPMPEPEPIPQPVVIPEPAPAPESNDTGGYVSGSCAKLRGMGLSNFRPGDPNYTKNRDRDGDGIACESS